MKKWVIVLFVNWLLCAAVSAASLTAQLDLDPAEGNQGVRVNPQKLDTGDSFTLQIFATLKDIDKAQGAQLVFQYDPGYLEVNSATNLLFPIAIVRKDTSNQFTVDTALLGDQWSGDYDDLFGTVGFQVIDGDAGSTAITLKEIKIAGGVNLATVDTFAIAGQTVLIPLQKPPVLAIRTTALDFGAVHTGSTSEQTFHIANTGQSNLTIAFPDSSQTPFTASSAAAAVAPGDSVAITVHFAPTDALVYRDTLSIATNDYTHPLVAIALTGEGYDIPGAVSIDLDAADGDQGARSLTIESGQTGALQLFASQMPAVKGMGIQLVYPSQYITLDTDHFAAGAFLPGATARFTATGDTLEITLTGSTSVSGDGAFGVLPYAIGSTAPNAMTVTLSRIDYQMADGTNDAKTVHVQATFRNAHPTADFNADSKVDFGDFLLFATAFGSHDSQFDLDGDGTVGFGDFLAFASQFGKNF